MDEKKKTMDRIIEAGTGDKNAYIIVCSSNHGPLPPNGSWEECDSCDRPIRASKLSVEKRKDGFFLVCQACFGLVLACLDAKGGKLEFHGSIRNIEMHSPKKPQ